MLAYFGAGAGAEGTGDEGFAQAADFADLCDEGGTGGLHIVRVGRLTVDFVPVAGGKDNRTRHRRRSGGSGCGDPGRTVAQLSNGLKIDVGVCSHQ